MAGNPLTVQLPARAQNRQVAGEHPIVKIYCTLQTGEPLSTKELQLIGTELKQLYAKKEALRI